MDLNAKGMCWRQSSAWDSCVRRCSLSVAFNWTFYYVLALAVAGREVIAKRHRPAPERRGGRADRRRAPESAQRFRVHA